MAGKVLPFLAGAGCSAALGYGVAYELQRREALLVPVRVPSRQDAAADALARGSRRAAGGAPAAATADLSQLVNSVAGTDVDPLGDVRRGYGHLRSHANSGLRSARDWLSSVAGGR